MSMIKWMFQYAWMTTKHKWFVFVAGIRIGVPIWLLVIHDMDKYRLFNLKMYGRQFFGDKKDQIGFDYAWLKHQKLNGHHWESWVPITGHHLGLHKSMEPLPMPEKYIKEMFADWMGAGRVYNGEWPRMEDWPWYDKNVPDMMLHEKTRELIDKLKQGTQNERFFSHD